MITALAGFVLLAGGAAAPEPHDVYGDWYTPERDSVVRIHDCGDGSPCGTVVWLDPETAQVIHDEHNDDAALRGRPILGVTLLSGFEAAPKGWRRGVIYNPGDGNSYRARVRRLDADTLEVKGCVGPICKGMRWARRPVAAASAE